MKIQIDYLVCKICEKVFTREEHLRTKYIKQIPLAMAEGWVLNNLGKAICPECFEKASDHSKSLYNHYCIGYVIVNQIKFLDEIKKEKERRIVMRPSGKKRKMI